MDDDSELLRRYVEERSEPAFAEVVERYVGLVYSAALREVGGDTASAEDLSQMVFSELARQAGKLRRHPALAGWLYTAVHRLAANWRRSQHRRAERELAAQVMNEAPSPTATDTLWQELRPVLDDAMHELRAADRTAVVLRYFEDRSLKQVGEALGLNENAARMRVDRALDQLRRLLARRGVTSTAASLSAALAAGAVVEAPAGLAAGIASTATAAATATSLSTSVTLLKIMSTTQVKAGLAGLILVTAVAVPTWQQTRIQRLAADNRQLHAQAAQVAPLQAEVGRLRAVEVDHAELTRLRAAEPELKAEVLRLRAAVTAAQDKASASAPVAAPATSADGGGEGAAVAGGVAGGMQAMVKGVLEQQLLGRMERMKQRLNLSPEQEQAIHDILMKQLQQGSEAAQKLFSGKLSPDELKKLKDSSGNTNPEEAIKALLTPEQQAAYADYQQEEAVSNARLAANAELLQMQGSLGLSQEQQDQVFNALYDYTVAQLSGKSPGAAPKDLDPVALIEWQFEQKAKALESVLTPAQLESYRKLQESQTKMIKGMLQPKQEAGGK